MAEDDKGTKPEDDVEDDETEEETTDDKGTETFKAPTEEDWKKTQSALKRAQREAAKLRLAAKGATKVETDKPDPAAEKAKSALLREKRMAGITGLTEAGMSKAQAKVAVRLLDLDAIEVDDDGDADVEDLIDDLKETFPGLFNAKAGTQRAPRVTTADRGSGTDTASSATQIERRIDNQLLKQAGYR